MIGRILQWPEIRPGMVDWKEVFKDVAMVPLDRNHPSNFTEVQLTLAIEAVKVASEMGVTISTDLNYRAKLMEVL